MTTEKPKNGLHTEYFENGEWSEENYKNGKLDGKSTTWYASGQIMYEKFYKDGKEHGLLTEWYESGKKWYELTFKDGER